jgi:hypothetical protein
MMNLAVPLSQRQIDEACRIHSKLKQWRLADDALMRLRERIPGFDLETCLLKSIAINSLYGTQVLAIVKMASHIHEVLQKRDRQTVGYELVEELAQLPGRRPIDDERFPIYDEVAREMIKLHLGRKVLLKDSAHQYQAFYMNFRRLKTEAEINCSSRNLDRYLWISGMYRKWHELKKRDKSKQVMNVELRTFFENMNSSTAKKFEIISPDIA